MLSPARPDDVSEALARRLIAEAASQAGVEIAETRKWGQPSFAPVKPRIGSSVRIEHRANGDLALMFICHTNLVERFRDIHGDRLALDGNRAILLQPGAPTHEDEIRHCIAMAFRYHADKGA